MPLNESLFSSEKLDWETPGELFVSLHKEFRFDIDVCANKRNKKLACFIGPRLDSQMVELERRLTELARVYKEQVEAGEKPVGLATQQAKAYQAFCEEIGEDSLSLPWNEQCLKEDGTPKRIPPKCWMNPPYGRSLPKWIRKAKEEASDGCLVVCLIPARPDTKYWHDYIWDGVNHRPQAGVQVRFLKGRLTFIGAESGAPFPSAIVVFYPWLVEA